MRNPTDKNVNPNGEILATTKTMPAMAGAQSAVRIQPPMKLAAVSKAILKPGVVTDGELIEDVIVSPEAAQADMMPATEGLAPLQAAGEGDVLLAQATGTPPPVAGAGGFAWTPGAVGAVAGGVVVVAAGSGGGSPTPVVPLAVSAPQRTATVYEDSDDMEEPTDLADGDYDGLASGDLTVGGDTTTFQTPTSLEGRYGDFTFNTTTGEWTYTLDNEDPDTQALNDYRGGKFSVSEYGPGMSFPGHDYLEVTTSTGFTTVIDVEIFGNTDDLELTPLAPVTVNANEWTVIDLSGAYGDDARLDYTQDYAGSADTYTDGGFVVYAVPASFDGESDSIYFEAHQVDYPGAWGSGEVQINVNAFDGNVDGDSPSIDWGFVDGDYPDIHESEAFNFENLWIDDLNGDGSTQMILVLDAYDWDDASFDLDIAAAGDLGVQVYGDGTEQIAIVGTESAINSFLAEDGLHLTVNDDYWDEEAGFNINIYATNGDGQSSSYDSEFYASSYEADYNDAPFLDVESGWGDGFFVLGDAFGVNDLSFFVPAGDDINSANSVVLDDFVDVNLWDEEDTDSGDGDWGYFGAYLDGDGTLSLLEDDGLISGDYVQIWAWNSEANFGDGDWDYWYASELTPEDLDAALNNFSSITFHGEYSYLETLAEGLHFNADEFFDVGETAELELYMTDSDEGQTTTSIFLVGAEANEAPVMTVNLGQVDFEDMEVADDEEPEVNVSGFVATAFEDQSINFKGFSVSDADVGDGELMLQFGAEMDWRYDQPLFYVDAAYADLVWTPDMTEYDGYFPWTEALFLTGSAEELNAALAAGAVHFIGAPDYNGEAYLWVAVTDFGQNGYIGFDDGDFSDMTSAAEILLTVEAVEDKPIAMQEVVMDSQDDMEDGGYWLANKTLLSADDGWYIYDAEYLNEEDGATLDVTGVTKLTGTGTLTGNAADGWTYTPGDGELDGTTGSEFATFSYTVSDGHSSVTNMISLLVPEIIAP